VSTEPDPTVVALLEPRDGVPDVVDTPEAFSAVVAAFAAGSGPVAVDAERASGYRYGQRAYLIQLRRDGAGTALIDPTALPDLNALSEALDGTEWVLHAASQDLPCLAETGMRPTRIFDTELAARLLGYDRVGLAAVVAKILGLGLAKEHSAVDWSTRPLPVDWLRYAALDVEVLVEIRDRMVAELIETDKLDWALEEFEAVRTAPPPPPRQEPWRRVSGLHDIRDPRRLAVVRELWAVRDTEARTRDIAPGRILPDRAIINAATTLPGSAAELATLPIFPGKKTRLRASMWFGAVERGLAVPPDELPKIHGPRTDGPPPVRSWRDKAPDALARLGRAKEVLSAISEERSVPVENLMTPDLVRRLCWSSPATEDVTDYLLKGGARPWQVQLVAPGLIQALAEPQA
jgi:ribonuclease D